MPSDINSIRNSKSCKGKLMPNPPKLKPCPFCEKQPRIFVDGKDNTHISCLNPKCKSVCFFLEKDRTVAIRAWNRRK